MGKNVRSVTIVTIEEQKAKTAQLYTKNTPYYAIKSQNIIDLINVYIFSFRYNLLPQFLEFLYSNKS